MKKRVFSAEFKAERVLEVLRGEKELNEISFKGAQNLPVSTTKCRHHQSKSCLVHRHYLH